MTKHIEPHSYTWEKQFDDTFQPHRGEQVPDIWTLLTRVIRLLLIDSPLRDFCSTIQYFFLFMMLTEKKYL